MCDFRFDRLHMVSSYGDPKTPNVVDVVVQGVPNRDRLALASGDGHLTALVIGRVNRSRVVGAGSDAVEELHMSLYIRIHGI